MQIYYETTKENNKNTQKLKIESTSFFITICHISNNNQDGKEHEQVCTT